MWRNPVSHAMNDVVLFEEPSTACDRRWGIATLDSPSTLNSLSLTMVRALTPKLEQWAHDPSIVGIVLQGRGEKAFSAGGDLRELYQSITASGPSPSAYAQSFFAEEYRLDYLIHNYPKPVLCWGHGIVMGGGIGLMAGASHRVVTASSRLAMPEITIGLFPDVGGSWFLRRMPGRLGLFLALTGAPLSAADAMFAGLADFALGGERRADVLRALRAAHWSNDADDNRSELARLLARYVDPSLPESKARKHFDVINELVAGDDLLGIAARLSAAENDDPWMTQAFATFESGSPTSAALAFELRRRAARLALADVLRLEYHVALGCCAHADFREGVRALLIDKDRDPRWNPSSLHDVTEALVRDHFEPRFAGAHPLADLS
jgi:enoyl-CoA hydratase/carnithine racemase